MKWLITFLLIASNVCFALYPHIYKSKAYNFNDPGVDAFELTLDVNNVLYLWREINGALIEVANIENFCEPIEAE
jgi:hypothetical protein